MSKNFKHSSVYIYFIEEREEVLKYKWIESEKSGYDIGYHRAWLDWHRKHKKQWTHEKARRR